ncbi:alpha/beta fold hydrolase [Fodinicola feengrottensis]|uniref:Alpha/beta fold hydrolase n=1 Tax=Fodinicola feengrottensis TaxID=435914 RepID=A0ABN2GIH4_9ACTN
MFVHGLLVNANLWRRIVPSLAADFRCVVLDLPFGSHATAMPAADLTPPGLAGLVAEAIEALGVGPVTLVGNDTGGAICQIVATTRPELLKRLVLTSSDAYDNFPPKAFGYLKVLASVPAAMLLLNALRLRPLRRFPLAYGLLSARRVPRSASDSYALPACVSGGVRADLRRLLRGLDKRHTLAAARQFAKFDRPVLIAWSQRDCFFPMSHAERLKNDFPDARLEWIPGARTFSPEDQPARLVSAIARFVDQTQASDAGER